MVVGARVKTATMQESCHSSKLFEGKYKGQCIERGQGGEVKESAEADTQVSSLGNKVNVVPFTRGGPLDEDWGTKCECCF